MSQQLKRLINAGLVMLALGWGSAACANPQAQPFGYNNIVAQAQDLAAHPYHPAPSVPQAFAKLDYSRWSGIHFKRSAALWQDSRFHVQFAPAGYLFKRAVNMHIVTHGKAHPLPFAAAMFRVNNKALPAGLPANLGFAGFRLTYPINRHDKQDEVLSFLGASYFRAVPKHGWFGLSARGVAIDTTAAKAEEFPRFTDFWLVKPAPDATSMTLYALLNGSSLSGAYAFHITPGAPTTISVRATLFLRHPVEQLGLAPLTSMFFYGAGNHKPANQLVPAIHDSDGLLIHHGKQRWLWRPLDNPTKVTTLKFPITQLKGFGLLQRDRRSSDYQDPSAHYAERPNLWIQPQGDWGAGDVTLVEIPTTNSYMDNIVAFWQPAKQPAPGEPLTLNYQMSWRTTPQSSSVGRVVATLIGGDQTSATTKYVIDYAGGRLGALDKTAKPSGWVTTQPATHITENRVAYNPYIGGFRQIIQVAPLPGKTLHITAGLGSKDHPLTESWHYRLAPAEAAASNAPVTK